MDNSPTSGLKNPKTLELVTPHVDEVENRLAFRRGKVRELMRMGYNAQQISIALQGGIKLSTGETITVPCSEDTIKKDIQFILEEEAAADSGIDLPSKRAEVLDKLRYLYNRAIREYNDPANKGLAKNSFLNTALSILKQQIDLDNLAGAKTLDVNVNSEARIATVATEIHMLGKEERHALLGAIRKVLGKRDDAGSGESGVSDRAPGVPAQAGEHEGVS